VWNALVSFYNFWAGLWTDVANVLTGIWNNYVEPVIQLIENAVSSISGAISTVANVAKGIGGFIGKVGSFLGFEEGGFVPGTRGAPQLIVAHGGEYVVSNDMLAGRSKVHTGVLAGIGNDSVGGSAAAAGVNTGGTGSGHVIENHTHVYLDGRQLQHTVERQQLRVGARRGQSYQPYKR
jgi:hypothetical protein